MISGELSGKQRLSPVSPYAGNVARRGEVRAVEGLCAPRVQSPRVTFRFATKASLDVVAVSLTYPVDSVSCPHETRWQEARESARRAVREGPKTRSRTNGTRKRTAAAIVEDEGTAEAKRSRRR